MQMNTRDSIIYQCYLLKKTLLSKNANYGNSALERPFLLESSSPTAGIMVRLGDKFARLKSLLNGGMDFVSESMDDTLLDIAGYSILARIALQKATDTDTVSDDCEEEKPKTDADRKLAEMGVTRVFDVKDKEALVEFLEDKPIEQPETENAQEISQEELEEFRDKMECLELVECVDGATAIVSLRGAGLSRDMTMITTLLWLYSTSDFYPPTFRNECKKVGERLEVVTNSVLNKMNDFLPITLFSKIDTEWKKPVPDVVNTYINRKAEDFSETHN